MFKSSLGLEGQSLKYSVNMVLTCVIYCVLLQACGYHIYLCWLRFSAAWNESRKSISVCKPRLNCFIVTRKLCLFRDVSCISLIEHLSLKLDVQVCNSFVRSGTAWFKCSCLRASLWTVLRVVFAVVLIWLCSCRTMVSILHMGLIISR